MIHAYRYTVGIPEGQRMEFHIEFYNTAASLGWAFAAFMIVGLLVGRKRGR